MDERDHKAMNEGLNQPLQQTTISKRFFFFAYAYWYDKAEGKGGLFIISKSGFPDQKGVKQLAIEQIKNRYNVLKHRISVAIQNWIEMSEDDYNQWLS